MKSFEERCEIAAACVPESKFREMLEKLHREMNAEIKRMRNENSALRTRISVLELEELGAADAYRHLREAKNDLDERVNALESAILTATVRGLSG